MVHDVLTRAHLIVSEQTDDEVDRGKDKTYEDRNEDNTQRVGADGLRGGIVHIKHVGTILRHSLAKGIFLTLVQQLSIETLTDLQTTVDISLLAPLVRYLWELREEARLLTLSVLEAHTQHSGLLVEAFDSVLTQLRECVVILGDDRVLRATTSSFDKLITLRLELVVLSDITIQRLIGYPDIQREVTVLAVRVGELREHIGDELQLGLNL